MIAAGPLYESGTFWTGLGTVAAIVAALIAFITWRLGAPRRQIVFTMETIALLPRNLPQRATDALMIMHGTVVLTDPRVVVLSVESRARRDITSVDFDQGKPLEFDLQAPILALLDVSPPEPDSPIDVLASGSRVVRIPPCLIRKGPLVSLQMLVDGQPDLQVRYRIINTDVRDKAADDKRNDRIGRIILITFLVSLPVAVGIASGGGFYSVLIAAFLFFVSIAILRTGTAFLGWLSSRVLSAISQIRSSA